MLNLPEKLGIPAFQGVLPKSGRNQKYYLFAECFSAIVVNHLIMEYFNVIKK